MWTVNHLQENELSAKGEHSLLPIVWVATALLKYPVIRRDFSSENLPLHIKLPDGGLSA